MRTCVTSFLGVALILPLAWWRRTLHGEPLWQVESAPPQPVSTTSRGEGLSRLGTAPPQPVITMNATSTAKKVIALMITYDGTASDLSRFDTWDWCPASCSVVNIHGKSNARDLAASADAVIFDGCWGPGPGVPITKRRDQRFLFTFSFEAPHLAGSSESRSVHFVRELEKNIDWTATFNPDSDFWFPIEGRIVNSSGFPPWMRQQLQVAQLPPRTNWAKNKTILLAWAVSNCQSIRMAAWRAITQYLPKGSYALYGGCPGHDPTPCPDRSAACNTGMWSNVKFYFAAENSRCKGYMTEKFPRGYQYGMVPLALGGLSRREYELFAPSESFLHVDDFSSAKHVAEFLMRVDRDDAMYNNFMAWRSQGLVQLVRPFFAVPQMCELCQQLYLPEALQKPRRSFGNVERWFYDDVCRSPGAKWQR